jgi:hypothetical protein
MSLDHATWLHETSSVAVPGKWNVRHRQNRFVAFGNALRFAAVGNPSKLVYGGSNLLHLIIIDRISRRLRRSIGKNRECLGDAIC